MLDHLKQDYVIWLKVNQKLLYHRKWTMATELRNRRKGKIKTDVFYKGKKVEYREAGMEESAIKIMYEFDCEMFRKNRTYGIHNTHFSTVMPDGEEIADDRSAFMKKFSARFSVQAEEADPERRYGWIDEIENPVLSEILQKMPEKDKELLTLYVIEDYTVTDIAKMEGSTHQNISKKIRRIKNILKNF